ncbi:MAG TPA: glycosyltransferase family 92 protein [Verrucomicrobiae bacterium]|nr:glycosyltransferase family 92 protein [Verrucomicrobiae bacterium]
MFRDEAPFLDEWLNFHAGIGVTHFYLYNNFSTDDFHEVLRPWLTAGFVTLTEWPVQKGQISAYDDCIRRFKNHARWIAFIDVDEFLFTPQSQGILPVLSSFAHHAGIEVWHVYFGANGHVKRPILPVTEAYTVCALPTTTTVKTIANPRLVYKTGVHQFKYWTGHGADTAGQVAGPAISPVFNVLRINHYWSRSFEDMHMKCHRGGASTTNERGYDWHLKFESKLNCKTDLVIQPLARAVQKSVR